MAPAGGQGAVGLSELLCNVGLATMDKVVHDLEDVSSLAAARLACRDLRDAIDGSIRKVHIVMTLERYDLFRAGHTLPLERWPRCNSVAVTLSEGVALAVGGSGASLLTLPFISLSPERRRQVTQLSCEVSGPELLDASLLSSLALWLPCLRELRLHRLRLACDPLQLGPMYDALATLPNLRLLALPGIKALEGVGALGAGGSGLTQLEVWEAHSSDGGGPAELQLGQRTLAELTRLQGLRRLSLFGCCMDTTSASLPRLIASLPPSMESLELSACAKPDVIPADKVAIELRHGRVQSADWQPSLPLPGLLALASGVLLPGLAPGQQLASLRLGCLEVAHRDSLDGTRLQTLQALGRCCRQLTLGALRLSDGGGPQKSAAQLGTAWQVVETLGQPQALELQVVAQEAGREGQLEHTHTVAIHLGSVAPGGRRDAYPVEVTAALAGWWRPFILPFAVTASAALWAAVQCMAALAVEPPLTLWTTGLKPAGSGDGGGRQEVELLLMRGSYAVFLCKAAEALGTLPVHMEQDPMVWCIATVLVLDSPSPPWSGLGRQPGKHIFGYQVVHGAGALLVACSSRVKRAMALPYTPALDAYGKLVPNTALEVLPLGIKWSCGASDRRPEFGGLVQHELMRNVTKVLQDVWDRGVAVGAGGVGGGLSRSALEWALLVRDQLAQELSPLKPQAEAEAGHAVQ